MSQPQPQPPPTASGSPVPVTPLAGRSGGERAGLALAAIVALGAVLRVSTLGRKSFWLDEAFSVALARAPWSGFVFEVRTREANMSLYYFVLRGWLHLGLSETTVRLLSVLAALATIPVVYALGSRLAGRRAALIAAAVIALDPLHLFQSQEARSYAIAVLLVACSTLAFVHAVEARDASSTPPGRRTRVNTAWWIAYVVCSVLSMYAHFYAAFVLLAQWLSLLGRPVHRTPWRALIGSGVAMAVLLAPIAVFLASGRHTNLDWLATAVRSGAPEIVRALRPVGLLAVLAYVMMPVTLVLAGARAIHRRDPDQRWPYVLITLWAATPVLIPLAVSIAIRPVIEARYLVVCVPAVALLAGTLIANLPVSAQRRTAFGVILAIELFGDWAYFARISTENWRDASRAVMTTAQPGDVALFYAPYVRRAFDYYAVRDGRLREPPLVLYPSESYATFDFSKPEGLSLADAIDRARRAAPRTWLVISHASPDTACLRALDAALRGTFQIVDDRRFAYVDVRLYSRSAEPLVAEDSVHRGAPPGDIVTRQCPQR